MSQLVVHIPEALDSAIRDAARTENRSISAVAEDLIWRGISGNPGQVILANLPLETIARLRREYKVLSPEMKRKIANVGMSQVQKEIARRNPERLRRMAERGKENLAKYNAGKKAEREAKIAMAEREAKKAKLKEAIELLQEMGLTVMPQTGMLASVGPPMGVGVGQDVGYPFVPPRGPNGAA